jgi:hypothetical protein
MLESVIVTALHPGQFLLNLLVLLPQLLKLCLKVLYRPFKLTDASVRIGVRLLSRSEAREHWGSQYDRAENHASGKSVEEAGGHPA